jgi:hypothetical protein
LGFHRSHSLKITWNNDLASVAGTPANSTIVPGVLRFPPAVPASRAIAELDDLRGISQKDLRYKSENDCHSITWSFDVLAIAEWAPLPDADAMH